MCSMMLLPSFTLAKTSSDVVLSRFFLRASKDILSQTCFNQFAKIEKGCVVRDTRSLLHAMSHNYNGVIFFKFFNQRFNTSR